MRLRLPPSRLMHDDRGATLIEFAILAPVMLVLVMGAMDVAHTIWAGSILEGEMQRAGRRMALESAGDVAVQKALDTDVQNQFQKVVSSSTVVFSRVWYTNYDIAEKRREDFTDTNADGTCNGGEAFQDANRNGVWDLEAGKDGLGGAKDAVLYTATATYPRLFPLASMIGLSPTVTVKASTVLRNQPYGEQTMPGNGSCV